MNSDLLKKVKLSKTVLVQFIDNFSNKDLLDKTEFILSKIKLSLFLLFNKSLLSKLILFSLLPL